MDLSPRRSDHLCLISIVIVISVLVENIGANVEFDLSRNDEDPKYSVFYEAAKLTQSLANRDHTKIATVSDVLMTAERLKDEIDDLHRDRVGYVERVRDQYKRSLQERIQSTNEFIASNELAINSIFDRTLGNDKHSANQLNAQIIRHHLRAPMNLIQSLLSLAMTELSQSVESDTEVAAAPNKTQLFHNVVEQLKYKPRVDKEVFQDLTSFLEKSSNYFFLKPTLDMLKRNVDEILASNRVPAGSVIKSLSNEWQYLTSIAIFTHDQPHLAKELQNLTTCPELGIAAYKVCRLSPTKLAAFSERVDEFRKSAELQRWKDYEQSIYDIVIPVLKAIEQSLDDEHATKFGALILPILPELENVLTEMQEHSLYGDDLSRATEDTRQLICIIISLRNHIQVAADKEALAVALQEIRRMGHELPRKMKSLDGIINTNLMLEMCSTTKEALKLRVIPFDKDYLELCDMPGISDPSEAEQHVKQNLLENIDRLKRKIRRHQTILRDEDGFIMIRDYLHPLYVWKNADFKNEITKLLKGEKAILNANIDGFFRAKRENVFKFSEIRLGFHFANESRQSEFYKAIDGIYAKMTMIGNNYFRCQNRIYYVPTDVNAMLGYRLKSNDSGDISQPNGLHSAVLERNEDPFLSPYTVWQMQLSSPELQTRLNEFIGDEIDLRLIGKVHYVLRHRHGKYTCDNLDQNYRVDRTLNYY